MAERLASLVDAVAAVVDALERAGIRYALGGAVAYSAWVATWDRLVADCQ